MTLEGLTASPTSWEDAADNLTFWLEITRGTDQHDWAELYDGNLWTQLAQQAITILGESRSWDRDGFIRMMASKQHDYGTENILKFGHEGLRVRLWDKVARLKNIERRGYRPKNESRIDTLTDIVGYVVIDMMLQAGWFELPLKEDQ